MLKVPSTDESSHDDDSGVSRTENGPTKGTTIGNYTNVVFYRDGSSSTVYKAQATSLPDTNHPRLAALKITVPSLQQPPHNSQREVRILRLAEHPSIIPLEETFSQPGGKLILVFPFMPYDLDHLLHDSRHRTSSSLLKSHLRSLFAALAHVHSRGIIHRDVKPSNILLRTPSGPAYLADFGIAWSPSDPASEPADKKITDVGTTRYRPPELLFGNTNYGCALDMWAAGCVVAEAVGVRGDGREKRTLFEAGALGSELALVKSIFETLGTPTLDTWPVSSRRSYSRIIYTQVEEESAD